MPRSRSEIEAPSIVRDRSGRSREIPFRRAAPAGRPVQLPRVFTVVQRLRLDLSSSRFHGTNRGRARPYDFCKWLSPRARLWTTRTSRSTKIRGRDGRQGSTGSFLPVVAAAGGTQGQGSGQPMPDIPVAIARAGDFAPTPIAPGTWCRKTPPLTGLERHGEERRCRRRAPLQGAPAERVVWGRPSAKRPSIDQPKVPSITQAFASERAIDRQPKLVGRSRRLFHHRRTAREDARVRSQ